ncbi:TPA: hypothetical protein N2C61_003525 [Pseudomonas aeruginosa]|nr:hypothetical protein [Pseudomonas aeruginosa]
MSPEEALKAIQNIMSGEEWSTDTLDAIRDVMEEAGYEIQDVEEVED